MNQLDCVAKKESKAVDKIIEIIQNETRKIQHFVC